jgi:Protein of unknown function (DUF1073)
LGEITVTSSSLGNSLEEMLTASDIVPGDQPSYQLCKTIWLYHPLGKKMVEGPISMAQSQPREISIADSPEDVVRDRFVEQWETDRCDEVIYQLVSVSRAYGIGSMAVMSENAPPTEALDPKKLADEKLAFSVFDPLNTAGSLVLDQNPLSIDFMKVVGIAVQGVGFHRSRTVTLMHERPVYISYTTSAYGFTGRSVFQRALFPLKSFVQSMITDDLVTLKAGVFIAKLKSAGNIIDAVMDSMAGLKRLFVKASTNGNVISIGTEEEIETLNMQNINGAFGMARKDILENIATSADMPAILLKQETFAEGFGEGTEDAKLVAGYISSFRRSIKPAYDFMDRIIMRRAWTKEFYVTVQENYAEYADVSYEEAFFRWQKSYKAQWPNLLTEPDSEKVKTDDVKLKAIIAVIEVFGPLLDPENLATLMGWAEDNLNENEMMFQSPLQLDLDALASYVKPLPEAEEPAQPKPFAANDSAAKRRRRKLADEDLRDLVTLMETTVPALPKPNGHLNGTRAAS